ncbi:MAG: glycosyltransferase family 4 protein [Candidatus Eisenbacteria bacterium]|nr:glycosyltransferase family 4 protein [Candidatus Eisenbacteria bacterium]
MAGLNQTDDRSLSILHLDTGREWRGGQQQVLYLARALAASGHRSVILTPKGSPLCQRARSENLEVREIPYHGAGDPIAIKNVVQAIQDTDAGVLHTHTANAHSLGFFSIRWPTLPRDRRPVFVVHRRVDFPPGSDPITRMRYTSEPAFFLCVSQAVKEILQQHGVAASRLRVVHSCVDPERIDAHAKEDPDQLRAELGIPAEAGLIGAVGSLVPHKGHRHLIAAMPRILGDRPEAWLAIFGDGPLESELRRTCWEHGLQARVTFAGFRPDVARFLHCFDVFAHPSTEEGLGTAILDAMSARLPVVATNAGGIPEAVRHGETGWLVPPASPPELAGAIISLLEDPRRRAQFGEAGRARVEAEFSIESLRDGVLGAYRELLAAQAVAPGIIAPEPADGGASKRS